MGVLASEHSEPIYDDVQLDMFREQGIRELLKALYDYSNQLCEKIASSAYALGSGTILQTVTKFH